MIPVQVCTCTQCLCHPAGCPPKVKEDLKNQMLDSCAAAVEAAAGLREGDRLPMKELLDLVQVDVPVAGKHHWDMQHADSALTRGRRAGAGPAAGGVVVHAGSTSCPQRPAL